MAIFFEKEELDAQNAPSDENSIPDPPEFDPAELASNAFAGSGELHQMLPAFSVDSNGHGIFFTTIMRTPNRK